MPTLLLVGLGAAAGAVTRYLVDRGIQSRYGRAFPWGTWVVNVSGSFALGLLVGLAPSQPVLAVVGTGVLGGYTTFSTFMVETLRLAEDGSGWEALGNLAASLVAGVVAAGAGLALGGLA